MRLVDDRGVLELQYRSILVSRHLEAVAPAAPAQHGGSAAKAAFNDCPHEWKAKGAHLAAFVSCIRLFDGAVLFTATRYVNLAVGHG